jgi:hypothetical protein
MLSNATDFWPIFWAIFGAAGLVAVALSVLIATISPSGARPRRGHQVAQAELAEHQAGQGYPEAA